jgi:LysR family transcriptional regulator, glycine cleavage system transcriptional activator
VLGRGVALAKATLAADDLAAGRLVTPFSLTMAVNFAYWLVYPPAKARLPKVVAFRDWIHSEAAAVTGT